MNLLRESLALLLIVSAACAAADYQNQDKWPGECNTGKKQSPVDIIRLFVKSCEKDFRFTLTTKGGNYVQTPQRPQAYDIKTAFDLSTISIENNGVKKDYNAKQFHFHRKSEHKFNGIGYDIELHVVHQASDKSLAVYGVLFRVSIGTFDDPFDKWNLDTTVNKSQPFPIPLETPLNVYYYQGSLTTPECHEGVQWFVNALPMKIKLSNYLKLKHLINHGKINNRDIQKLNGRVITQSGKICHLKKPQADVGYGHQLHAHQ